MRLTQKVFNFLWDFDVILSEIGEPRLNTTWISMVIARCLLVRGLFFLPIPVNGEKISFLDMLNRVNKVQESFYRRKISTKGKAGHALFAWETGNATLKCYL